MQNSNTNGADRLTAERLKELRRLLAPAWAAAMVGALSRRHNATKVGSREYGETRADFHIGKELANALPALLDLAEAAGAWRPTREQVARIIRQHVKCDARGLAPAVASVYLTGFNHAADAILALTPAPDATIPTPAPAGDGGESPKQAFERHPKLAAWIEKLANRKIEAFSLASWCAFLGEINAALDREAALPPVPAPGGGVGEPDLRMAVSAILREAGRHCPNGPTAGSLQRTWEGDDLTKAVIWALPALAALTPSPEAPAEVVELVEALDKLPYSTLFNAIAAATNLAWGEGAIGISVQAFIDHLRASRALAAKGA